MTTIKASCPTCGEVELTPADVSLMVCSHAPLSYYAFDLPDAAPDEVRKPADDHVVVAARQRRRPGAGLGPARRGARGSAPARG